ncbi:ABC transporter permease [Minwuia sp.]|uniref:ABC transporter permease n=1 Tax=Minwuia sp. TaxID=2493630 RepID=UPI003A8D00BD
MIAFIIRRLIQAVLVMLVVALIGFTMFRFVGDPVAQMVGQDTSLAERAELREKLGLNDPVMVQFGRYIGQVVQGDFGISYRLGRPVDALLAERFPATLELVIVAALFALLIGVPTGVYTGLYPRSWLSQGFLTFSLMGISLPTFLIGILLMAVFSVILNWLPSSGRGETVDIGLWETGYLTSSGWLALIMPGITLGMFQLALVMRLVRSEMLEVLRTDFVKFARARGLSNRAVHFRHALKNTMIPVITITGLQLGSLIAFAIVTETVFQWPGMGLLFLQAVQFADVPVMSTYLIVVAFIFVVLNLIVDLLYYAVDPRLRVERTGGGH